MFTTNCFIHSNTKEIRKKLEGLGYLCGEPEINGLMDSYKSIFTRNGQYWGSDMEVSDMPIEWYGIDCGKNEELFIAIAAMQDKYQTGQFFITGNGEMVKVLGCGSTIQMDGKFSVKVEIKRGDKMFQFEAMFTELRKATIDELIEHFKK